MRKRRIGWRYGLVGAGMVVALAAVTVATAPSLFRKTSARENLTTTTVRRTDLTTSLAAGGRIDSSERTVIECELEALDVGIKGNRILLNGSSTLLSIIPDGTLVKQGDVLAVLDASDYEDVEVTQRMNVDRAQADHLQAELNLEVAKLAVVEYREGTWLQMLQTLEGKIALAQSEQERARDRVEWSRRMVKKGYIPKSQVTSEEFIAARSTFNLRQGQTQLRLFKLFNAPMYMKILDSEIKMAEALLTFQDLRLRRNQERLQHIKKMVDLCTIRAPHDGFVIHANEEMRNIRIEAGMGVRQRQRLFYLPDLTKMEVATLLHESISKDVKPGMRARVRIEAMAGRELEGHVTSISQLPSQTMFFSDVKYFTATVKLDTLPNGLKPGMSAEVLIETMRRPDVLTVPTEALTVQNGHDVCYVAYDDHLERREVKIGQSTRDLLEVTEGLEEGDEVVLDPTRVPGVVEVVSGSELAEESRGDSISVSVTE